LFKVERKAVSAKLATPSPASITARDTGKKYDCSAALGSKNFKASSSVSNLPLKDLKSLLASWISFNVTPDYLTTFIISSDVTVPFSDAISSKDLRAVLNVSDWKDNVILINRLEYMVLR